MLLEISYVLVGISTFVSFRGFTVLFSEKESVYLRVLEFPSVFAVRQVDTEFYNHCNVKQESDQRNQTGDDKQYYDDVRHISQFVSHRNHSEYDEDYERNYIYK